MDYICEGDLSITGRGLWEKIPHLLVPVFCVGKKNSFTFFEEFGSKPGHGLTVSLCRHEKHTDCCLPECLTGLVCCFQFFMERNLRGLRAALSDRTFQMMTVFSM